MLNIYQLTMVQSNAMTTKSYLLFLRDRIFARVLQSCRAKNYDDVYTADVIVLRDNLYHLYMAFQKQVFRLKGLKYDNIQVSMVIRLTFMGEPIVISIQDLM